MPRNTIIAIRLSPEEANTFKRLAELLQRSRSDAVRIAVAELLRGLPQPQAAIDATLLDVSASAARERGGTVRSSTGNRR